MSKDEWINKLVLDAYIQRLVRVAAWNDGGPESHVHGVVIHQASDHHPKLLHSVVACYLLIWIVMASVIVHWVNPGLKRLDSPIHPDSQDMNVDKAISFYFPDLLLKDIYIC